METLSKVLLTKGYNKRYSLDYLIWKRKLEHGREVRETVEELAGRLKVTTRTIYNWVKEELDSDRREIDQDTQKVLGNYFGIEPGQVLTENCAIRNE